MHTTSVFSFSRQKPLSIVKCLAATFLCGLAPLTATAGEVPAEYPAKSVRIVAGFPAGGAADLLARLSAQQLAARYSESFVVENKAGAGGTIGAANVARSPADGYSLLLGTTATQTIAPFIYPNLQYDAAKGFEPIALLATIPVALVVHPSLDVNSASELVAAAKKSTHPITFASSGTGAIPHLTAELFQMSQGVKMEHIPFKGAPAAMADLLSGRVQVMFDHLPSVLPHIQTGKLKVLGIAGDHRAASLPDVKTLQEQGIGNVAVRSWFGMLAPAGTSKDVIDSVNAALMQGMAQDSARETLAGMGAEFSPSTPAEFARIIESDTAMWANIVKTTQVGSN